MSIPIPLAVRLRTIRADRIVTGDLRDLSFRSVAPGGFANVQFQLDAPLRLQRDELDYYSTVSVIDRRNGQVVAEGRVEDLGRTAGDGEIWAVAAIGPSAHAEDITRPYIVVDRQSTSFKPSSINKNYVNWQVTNDDMDPGGGLMANVPRGTDVPGATDVADNLYQQIFFAGQKVARVRVDSDVGFVDTAWKIQIITKTGPSGTKVVADDATASTGGVILVGKLTTDGGNIVNGNNCVTFRARHDGASGNVVPDDLCWFEFDDWYVRTLLLTKAGAEITSGYTLGTVTADQVVADLLGRFLPLYDGAGASIAANSYAIDQLAYYDGVSPKKVFEDLMVLEAAFYWAAWEANSAGLNRFEWVAWPTTVGYEAGIADGFVSPGSAVELYNAVRVRYQTTSGNIKNLQRTQSVPRLTAAGLTREWPIDLGDNIGSTANATQVGDQFLADHLYPPNAGTLTVARPIIDFVTGRMVMPWEIKPGRLIRVRGVQANVDSLNPSGRDGSTVFRVKAVSYQASSASADLELDAYPQTTVRALAELARKPPIRRR